MRLPPDVTDITEHFLSLIDESAPGLVTGLYLRGSLGFGEYFEGRSDVDFTAVLSARPGTIPLDALAAAHEAVHEKRPLPHFDGFHLVGADLREPPDRCPDLPCMFEGAFRQAGRLDVNPVSWHELASQGITIRGPRLTAAEVWTDSAALRAYSHGNLTSYWAAVVEQLRRRPTEAATPEAAAWCVLGVSRLHHVLATGSMTSKSAAGRYALTAFKPRWQPIVREALRARERPHESSVYDHDRGGRGRDTTAFTAMVIKAGLALGA